MAQSIISNASNDALEEARGDLGHFEHSLAKKGTKIAVYVMVMEIETGFRLDKSKTIGTITTKNSNKILMTAHSGYSTGLKRENSSCLDTNKWNYLALHHIAKQINFKFPKNIRDNAGHPILDEHRGRAHAGHVEVLLASWFVLYVIREEFGLADKSEKYLITQLKRLRGMKLGNKRIAFITIDSEPCRTCLQFLNRLSQYTNILFQVSGSKGVGPIQVRIDGGRREDVVGDTFADSEDDAPIQEANVQVEESTENVPPQDVPIPDLLAPITPTTSIPRRPATSWGRKPIQWKPIDPDELLSSYKKKTPEFKFPGYNREACQDSAIPSPSFRTQPTDIRPLLMSSSEEGEPVIDMMIEDDSNDWEDLGGGLSNNKEDDDLVKYQQSVNVSPGASGEPSSYVTANVSGHSFATSAYETIEMEYEVERLGKTREYPPSPLPRRLHRQPTAYHHTKVLHRPNPISVPRLQRFRHLPIDNEDESIFKSRYSILNPKYKR
ncbi:hypothetical protein CIB48_g526 [Xylaria polymorpha]|nr:hypothetical protein CIB48_g526 [Xylaria polymorpha]